MFSPKLLCFSYAGEQSVEVDEGMLRSNVDGLWLSLLPCLVSFARGSTTRCLSFEDRDLVVEREPCPAFESLPFSSDA